MTVTWSLLRGEHKLRQRIRWIFTHSCSSIQINPSQSVDEYYDTLSFPCQEERYGQDEEDRQWDSGGTFYNDTQKPVKTGKKLPAIPNTGQGHKRRSSFATVDEG